MADLTPTSSPFEPLRHTNPDGSEYWSARDLQPVMGYDRWERFESAIERASVAAGNSGTDPTDHFRGAAKMVGVGSGAFRSVLDWHLSRYASYLVAMNGDPRKPEIAAAQTYFAVRTREAEIQQAVPVPAFEIPTSFADALELAARQARELETATARVAELEPAARAWDTLADATGDYSLRDAAHILNRDPAITTGQNRLMAALRDLGMVDRRGIPYAKHSSHLVERAVSYDHPHTGEPMLKTQVRITARGLRYLRDRLTDPVAPGHDDGLFNTA